MNARLISLSSFLSCAALSLLGCAPTNTPAASEPPSLLTVPRPESCAGATLTGNTLDVDLSLVHLRGSITLNGQPLPPASLERGAILLVDARSASVQRISLGTNSTGAMDVMIPKGTYEVRYLPPRCDLARDDAMPCTPMVIERALEVQSDTRRDFALKSVTATFVVTLDGAPSAAPEGALVIEGDAGASSQLQLASLRPVPVWPGAYRVRYASASNCSAMEQRWPCNNGVVARDVRIDEPRAVSVDVRTTLVTTPVTVNGAPAAFSTQLSSIQLRDSSGRLFTTQVATRLGSLGPMRLLRDRYELFWAPQAFITCLREGTMPCNRGRLAELSLEGATHTSAIAVQTVLAQGTVTVDGAPAVTMGSIASGEVFFVDDEKNRASTDVSMDSRFALRLFRGARGALGYNTRSSACGGTNISGTTLQPCGEGTFAEASTFDADRTVTAAVATHNAPLSLTVDGQVITSNGVGELSTVSFASTIPGAQPTSLSLSNSARLRLVKGSYSITSVNGFGGAGCSASMALPCGTHVLASGRAVTESGPIALSVTTRRIAGAVRINGTPAMFAPSQSATVGLFSIGATALTTGVTTESPATFRAHVIDAPIVGYITHVDGCSIDEPAGTTTLCGVSFFAGCAAR
jgi:hypothetical protein